MGCDIHIWAERKTANGYEALVDEEFSEGNAPFNWRSYGLFGLLADVRNYSNVPPIAEIRGWPTDASQAAQANYDAWYCDAHSPSWLTIEDIENVDYDATFYDERDDRLTTIRDFLWAGFFDDIAKLKAINADRVVFFFDC